jgi:hypothetical protein
MDLQKDSLFVIYLINDHFIFISWLWKLWSVKYNLFNSVFTKVDITLSKGWSLLQVFLSLTYNSLKLYFLCKFSVELLFWVIYWVLMFGYLYICFIWLVIEVISHFNYISICLLLQVKLTNFPFVAFSISWSNRLYQL